MCVCLITGHRQAITQALGGEGLNGPRRMQGQGAA